MGRKILTAMICLLALTSCATETANWRLGEVSEKYSSYEGSDLDPLSKTPVARKVTGIQKYDDFFAKTKKLIITVEFGDRVAQALKSKHEKNEPADREKAAAAMVLASLPETRDNLNKMKEAVPGLIASAKQDFTGTNARNLPGVLDALNDTRKDLEQSLTRITTLAGDLGSSPTVTKTETRSVNLTEIPSGPCADDIAGLGTDRSPEKIGTLFQNTVGNGNEVLPDVQLSKAACLLTALGTNATARQKAALFNSYVKAAKYDDASKFADQAGIGPYAAQQYIILTNMELQKYQEDRSTDQHFKTALALREQASRLRANEKALEATDRRIQYLRPKAVQSVDIDNPVTVPVDNGK